MDKIGILPNATKDKNLKYTKELVSWLASNFDLKIFVHEEFSKILPTVGYYGDIHEICRLSDFVIVLGGDGTILDKATVCAIYDTPLVGINLGSIGYLTDVDKNDGYLAIQNILNKKYNLQKRMMVETIIAGKKHYALNDICVLKSNNAKLITFDIYINDEYIDTFRADGVIVSTPSGSTAYNLSAGGPIVKPDLDIMVITPICPYKMYSRSLVVSGSDIVKISSNDNVLVSVDGNNTTNTQKHISISKSKYQASIIKTTNLGFYDILRKKFS